MKNQTQVDDDTGQHFSDDGHVRYHYASGPNPLVLSPLCVGNTVLIGTVTNRWVGEIVELSRGDIVLHHAARVTDTGRWHQALDTGVLVGVEVSSKASRVCISRGAMVDCVDWCHPLPIITRRTR